MDPKKLEALNELAKRHIADSEESTREIVDTISARFGGFPAHGVEIAINYNKLVISMLHMLLSIRAAGCLTPKDDELVMKSAETAALRLRDAEVALVSFIGASTLKADPDSPAGRAECEAFGRLCMQALSRLATTVSRIVGEVNAAT